MVFIAGTQTFPEELGFALVHERDGDHGVVGHLVVLHVVEDAALGDLLHHLRTESFVHELRHLGYGGLQVLEGNNNNL